MRGRLRLLIAFILFIVGLALVYQEAGIPYFQLGQQASLSGLALRGVQGVQEDDEDDERYEKALGQEAVVQSTSFVFEDSDFDDEEDYEYEQKIFDNQPPARQTPIQKPNISGLPKPLGQEDRQRVFKESEPSDTLLPEELSEEQPAQFLPAPEHAIVTGSSGAGGSGLPSYRQGDVIITEVAWMGNASSATYEWIELKNTTEEDIFLEEFSLLKQQGLLIGETGDTFNNSHYISAQGYFLLERDELATGISADKLYDGTLSNSGEVLILQDAHGNELDQVDMASGWQAGQNNIQKKGFKPTMSRFASSTDIWLDGVPTPRAGNILSGEEIEVEKSKPFSFATSSIVITEVAWMGNASSNTHEWIEIFNNTTSTVNLEGWVLGAQDGSPHIELSGVYASSLAYLLLERVGDDAVPGIKADMIYTGALENSGEILLLKDPNGKIIDAIGEDGQGWYAGDNETKKTMQKRNFLLSGRSFTNWFSANPTPRAPNKEDEVFEPDPAPEPKNAPPSFSLFYGFQSVVINEVAWMGTHASSHHEWIELKNTTTTDINLADWRLLFATNPSSTTQYMISFEGSDIIKAGEFLLLERNTDLTLPAIQGKVYSGGFSQMSNSGEHISLKDAQNRLVDVVDGSPGWPAGSNKASPIERRSMERSHDFVSWYTFDKSSSLWQNETLVDSLGFPVLGTPGCENSQGTGSCAIS